MVEIRRVRGARALLFERLVGAPRPLGPDLPDDALRNVQSAQIRPFIRHNRDGLRASVQRELECLLSTRLPVDAATLTGRQRTTLDYGIPDLSLYPVGESVGEQALTRAVTEAITVFEPRLHAVAVVIERRPERPQVVKAIVTGRLSMDDAGELVSFILSLSAEKADHVG